MTDPAVVANAIRELRALAKCECTHPYPLESGRHERDCLQPWREDVDLLADDVERLRRVDELARALVERWRSLPRSYQIDLAEWDAQTADLLNALAAEVGR